MLLTCSPLASNCRKNCFPVGPLSFFSAPFSASLALAQPHAPRSDHAVAAHGCTEQLLIVSDHFVSRNLALVCASPLSLHPGGKAATLPPHYVMQSVEARFPGREGLRRDLHRAARVVL